MLDRVVETFHLKPCDDGKIRDIQENGDDPVYAPETPVSMNFWGFTPWLFEKLDAYFKDFLRALPDGELKKECLLPSLIGGNEVQAPCDCVIEEILQEDGALVSFGEPLLRYREG